MNCIIKPPTKSQEVANREIEEAMKKVKEAQSLITAAVDPSKSFHHCTMQRVPYTYAVSLFELIAIQDSEYLQ